jgi:hypothetical protein
VVDVYVSMGRMDLIVDVNGYFSDGSGSSPTASFHTATETRLHDTRSSRDTLPPAGQLNLAVAGTSGSPVPVVGVGGLVGRPLPCGWRGETRCRRGGFRVTGEPL